MKAYQIKIILKNSKPPVWRRCLIPAGITFSQLALILDDIVETEKNPDYEYEFYQAGIHVREGQEEESETAAYYYGFLCASDTFIDGLAEKEAWFTFRPGDRCQYRVEIEKGLPERLPCPVIIKEKADVQKCCWRNAETVNRRLEELYPIRYGEPDYRTFSELREDVESRNRGIVGANHPEDKTDRNRDSGRAMVQTAADMLVQRYAEEMKTKLLENAQSRHDGEDVDRDSLRSVLEDTAWRMKQDIRAQVFGQSGCEEASRHPDIKEFLLGETKDTLQEMAEDLRLTRYKSLNKDRLAEKIRDEILKPEVMAKRMLLLSDDEMQQFEKAAAKKNGYYPDLKEMENLEKLYNLIYVMLYYDDYAEVPREAAEVYQTFNTPEYQEERRGTYWLYHCLLIVEMFYASAPVTILCRMMKKCLGRKIELKELEALWKNIPDELNPCVIRDDRVIYKEVLKNQIYLRIEKTQEGKEFFIPGPDEIAEYTENGYPVFDPYYRRLKTFLIRKMNMSADEAEDYMPAVWGNVSMGRSLSDIMDIFGEEKLVFPSDQTIREFVSIMTDVNNHTRMLVNRGWTPEEIMAQTPSKTNGKMPTIVPMSSEAARLLGEAQKELKDQGFDVDLDYNADEITTMSMPDGISGKTVVGTKKIYPNDPCPCGSGKKYKKCCGRK